MIAQSLPPRRGAMTFLQQLLLVLGASLLTTLVFRRLRLPTVVTYIAAGALVGPHFLGWISAPEDFALVAEFGVAFLLFSIGLEFSLERMWALRFAVFGVGSVQVAACALIFGGAIYLWGSSLAAAVILAGALAFSSTALVTRELNELQQFHTRYAQTGLGVLLFQDLAAVVFLVLIPVLGDSSQNSLAVLLSWSLFKGFALFLLLMAAGKWLLPRIYAEVAQAGANEVFVLGTLVIALLAAWLTHGFGLSMALGSFVIGMMLSETPFKHQIIADIRPFRDILLGLFFVAVGMNVELSLLPSHWARLLLFTAVLIAVKALVVAAVARVLGSAQGTDPIRVGLILAQAGEFGLALITLAQFNRIVPPDQGSFVILIIVFSMMLSPLLIRNNGLVARWLARWLDGSGNSSPKAAPVTLHRGSHVVIGGFGRVGETLAQLLEANDIPYVGIDWNIERVGAARSAGRNVVYGDCARLDILSSCHIATARLAILTFRSLDLARVTIAGIRAKGVGTPIIVRCSEHGGVEELISIGADHVVPEMLEASLLIAAQALSLLGIPPGLADRQLHAVREARAPETI